MTGDSTDEPDPNAPDYYGFIGVARDASQDEVDSALTRAKGIYHPDQSSLGDRIASRCFDRVRDAESVLTDPDRRSAYDTFIERFGPENGHEAYENWVDSGSRVDPEQWDPETETPTTGRGPSTTSDDATDTDTTRRSRTTAAETDTDNRTAKTRQGTARRSRQRSDSRGRPGASGSSQRDGTANTEAAGRRTTGGHAGGPWMGPVYSRLSTVRQRVPAGRLAVFMPVAVWMGRGLDLAVAPGLNVRENVSMPAQFAVLSMLTLGAYLAVAFAGSPTAVLASVVWLVAGIVLYVAGSALWLFAASATYFVEGTGPPFYTALVVLVVVLGYALLVFGKADRRPGETRGK